MNRPACILLSAAAWMAIALASPAAADEPATPEQVEFFEKKIRPILAENCHKCHGPEKHQGNLRLDSKIAALTGGDSGAVIVPGKPDESLLIEAINYKSLEMPP